MLNGYFVILNEVKNLTISYSRTYQARGNKDAYRNRSLRLPVLTNVSTNVSSIV